MSVSWSNITFEIEKPNKSLSVASSDPPTRGEKFKHFICSEWNEEVLYNPPGEFTVTFSTSKKKRNEEKIGTVFSEFGWVTRAVGVYCTDDTYAGAAFLYENEDGEVTEVDSFTDSASGARGHDARKHAEDNWNIDAYAERFW
jgi:hypothetical protein